MHEISDSRDQAGSFDHHLPEMVGKMSNQASDRRGSPHKTWEGMPIEESGLGSIQSLDVRFE